MEGWVGQYGKMGLTRKWSFLSISGHFLLHVGFNRNKTGTKGHSSYSLYPMKATEAEYGSLQSQVGDQESLEGSLM